MADPVGSSEISAWWAIWVSIVMGLVSLGAFKAKVATKADLEKVEDGLRADQRRSLYREDGTSIFTPRAECEKDQASCGKRVCDKLDELQRTNAATFADIRADSQRRHEEGLEAQREHLRLHGELSEFVGTVKQFMQQKKGGVTMGECPSKSSCPGPACPRYPTCP